MPRPKPDEAQVREQLFVAAEYLLSRHGPGKLTVSDIAERCDMSQSNAYRYFPTKAALMSALAARWFADVESELVKLANKTGDPEETIRRFFLTQFQLKLDRYKADPVLFSAYLDLALRYPRLVEDHVSANHAKLRQLVVLWCKGPSGPDRPVAQVFGALLDATLIIRDPVSIHRFAEDLSVKRARVLIDTALAGLKQH